MATWGISQPRQGRNGNVVRHVRLVITDVPDEATSRDVLAWFDDLDVRLDSADLEEDWTATQQLSAQDAPQVRWTGGEIDQNDAIVERTRGQRV